MNIVGIYLGIFDILHMSLFFPPYFFPQTKLLGRSEVATRNLVQLNKFAKL